MNTDNSRARPAAEAARSKIRENVAHRLNTLEEIKRHFGVLLELRDRSIAELERKLALAPMVSDIDRARKDRQDLKILVVESSVATRNALVSVLRRGFYVSGAADGYAALELMANRPDMVLTSLNLPYVDGLRMIEYIRQIANDTAIIVILDDKDNAPLPQLRALGVETFVRKPYRLDGLIAQIEAVAKTCTPRPMNRILAVCPDAHERRALYALLEDQYHTVVAASAAAAIEMAGTRPDLLMVDAAVGEVSWEHVVSAFREQREDVKVLTLCDSRNVSVIGPGEAVPARDVVIRPYCLEEIAARVQELLGIKPMTGFLRKIFRHVT